MRSFLVLIFFLSTSFIGYHANAQCTTVPGTAANSCEYDVGGTNTGLFSNTCTGDFTLNSGIYERTTTCYGFSIGNSDTYQIDRNITITGSIVIDLNQLGSVFEILSGNTLTITGDLTIIGNSATEKQIVVDGNLIVGGTLDFGQRPDGTDMDIEIDGSGSISAGSVKNGGNTTCSDGENGGTGTCPNFDVDGPCEPAGSGLCGDTALPIELLFFNANINEGTIGLTWSTASEESFDYFSIERSADADNYEVIGTIPGHGWSDKIIEYSFNDNAPLLGRAYYRLKATDFDGTFEYFKPVMVNNENGSRLVKLSSNPVGDEPIKFQLNFKAESNIYFTITDLSGVTVISGTLAPGLSQYSIEKHLDKGMYLLKVSDGNQAYITRFLKK